MIILMLLMHAGACACVCVGSQVQEQAAAQWGAGRRGVRQQLAGSTRSRSRTRSTRSRTRSRTRGAGGLGLQAVRLGGGRTALTVRNRWRVARRHDGEEDEDERREGGRKAGHGELQAASRRK